MSKINPSVNIVAVFKPFFSDLLFTKVIYQQGTYPPLLGVTFITLKQGHRCEIIS